MIHKGWLCNCLADGKVMRTGHHESPQWFAATLPNTYATCKRVNSTFLYLHHIQYIVLHIYIFIYMTCTYLYIYIYLWRERETLYMHTWMKHMHAYLKTTKKKSVLTSLYGSHFQFTAQFKRRMDWPFVRRKTATCWSWGLGVLWGPGGRGSETHLKVVVDLVLAVWFM